MKNFSQQNWNNCLAKKHWEILASTEDVNEMAIMFRDTMEVSLNEIAPFKTFTIKPSYKHGLSQEAKDLIKEREKTRKDMKQSISEKHILHEKYKKTPQ